MCSILRLFDAYEVCVQYLYLALVFTTVTDDGNLLSVGNALGYYEVLELFLLTCLFSEQTIDVYSTGFVSNVEVTILVAVFDVAEMARDW